MGKISNFRWRLERSIDCYKARGLGFFVRWGCMGSTYGEDGKDYFLTLHFILWRRFELGFAWKYLAKED